MTMINFVELVKGFTCKLYSPKTFLGIVCMGSLYFTIGISYAVTTTINYTVKVLDTNSQTLSGVVLTISNGEERRVITNGEWIVTVVHQGDFGTQTTGGGSIEINGNKFILLSSTGCFWILEIKIFYPLLNLKNWISLI